MRVHTGNLEANLATKHTWITLSLITAIGSAVSSTAWAQPEFGVRGRVNLDAAFVDADQNPELGSGTLMRRGRIGVDGTLNDDWDFQVEYDFAGGSATANDVRMRRSLGPGRLIIGQVKVPMGMSELASSNDIPFIERSSANNLVVDTRRLGLSYHMSQGPVTFQSMVYTNAINQSSAGNDPIGMAGRVVFNPVNDGNSVIHLGLSAALEDLGTQSSIRFRERPESRPANGVRVIDTGNITDVNSTAKIGLEFAYQTGPFTAEAEYFNVDADRTGASTPSFGGYHVQASYFLTGEVRSYRGGIFGGITPSGSNGAWEVAARYSSADLDDSGIVGGGMDNVTLAANYYVSANLRFMANLIFSDVTDGRFGDENINIFLMRAQYHF